MLALSRNYSIDTLNNMIYDIGSERRKYLSFANYEYYTPLSSISESEWDGIRKVSINKKGEILAFYSSSVNFSQEKAYGLFLVNFRNDDTPEEDIKIMKEDLRTFILDLYNDPRFYTIRLEAIADNPANKLYQSWIDEFGGQVLTEKETVILRDCKKYDVNLYYINTNRKNEEKAGWDS